MTTKREIIENPEIVTGAGDYTTEDVSLFVSAVETLEATGLTENEAINQVFGNGDWYARAVSITTSD